MNRFVALATVKDYFYTLLFAININFETSVGKCNRI